MTSRPGRLTPAASTFLSVRAGGGGEDGVLPQVALCRRGERLLTRRIPQEQRWGSDDGYPSERSIISRLSNQLLARRAFRHLVILEL